MLKEPCYLIKVRSFINSEGKGVYAVAVLPMCDPMKHVPILLNTVSETDRAKLELMAIHEITDKFNEPIHLVFETVNRGIYDLLKSGISNQESSNSEQSDLLPKKLKSLRYDVQLGAKNRAFYTDNIQTFMGYWNTCEKLARNYRALNDHPVFHSEMSSEKPE